MYNTFIPTKAFSQEFPVDGGGLKEVFTSRKTESLTPFELFEKNKFAPSETNRTDLYNFSPQAAFAKQQEKVFSELESFGNGFEIENLHELMPRNGGIWENKPGDSMWKPGRNEIPQKNNPEGKTWGEILDEYGIEGIEFHDGEPDFSKISRGTVEIEDFSGKRDGEGGNYEKADKKLADQWNLEGKDGRTDWTKDDVQAYRKENHLTWHERSDMKTMDLVPTAVHANISHSGGISEFGKQSEQG